MTTAAEVKKRMRQLAKGTLRKVSQKGSHVKWEVFGHCRIIVPEHRGDIPEGTLSSIQRQGKHCLGDDWLK